MDKLAALRHKQQIDQMAQLERSVVGALEKAVKYLEGKTSKTEVVNQLKEIGTPDALKVVAAINELHKTQKTHKNVDLTEVTKLLKDLVNKEQPKFPEQKDNIKVTNLSEIDFSSLEKAVKALKLDPKINLPAPVVNVETNQKPVEAAILRVITAIEKLRFPEVPKTDLSGLEGETKQINKHLEDHGKKLQKIIEKPMGGGGGGGSGTSFKNSSGNLVYVELTADGKVPVDATFSGTIEGTSAFADSGGTDQKGLVDADKHVQVDVLTSGLPTGAATAAKQLPDNHQVTVSNFPATQTVSGTVTANTGLTQPTTPSDTQPISAASLPLPTGAATSAKQLPDNHQVTVSNFPASQAVTGTFWQATQPVSGPLTDTQLRASDVKITLDGETVPVTGTFWQATQPVSVAATVATKETQPSSSSVSSVANSVTSVTLLSSNANRRQATIFNDDSAASLYVKLGATASTSSYTVKIAPGGYYELPQPVYTGVIDGIASAATGNARITELT